MRRPSAILPAVLVLASCASAPETATDALPMDATGLTRQVAAVKDNLDAADVAAAPVPAAPVPLSPVPDGDAVPALKGLGFAQIAGQPGATMNEKRLMAIRAARMDALRDLAEQVHGIRLSSTTTIRDAVVQDDSMTALVDGTIRGARTVRVTPKGTDSYEVEMMLDSDTVAYIVRALKGRV